jgi:hypothetical protein
MHNGRRLLCLVMASVALALGGGSCRGPNASAPDRGALTFGVAPGRNLDGATPWGAEETMAALEKLRPPGGRFMLHLYTGYTGALPWKAYQASLHKELARFERSGFGIELVVRYAPFGRQRSPYDVPGFVTLVHRIVETFGKDRRFVSVQITNEPDRSATAASDGYFNRGRRTWEALIKGVIAAKATARAAHFDHLTVGFNYSGGDPGFWRYLASHGGTPFRRALDWIGIDSYPGTATPLDAGNLQAGTANAIGNVLYAARRIYMPLADIPARVAIHFSENGYATSVRHTYAMQAKALEAAVRTVSRLSGVDHVTEYNWFELRDGSSSDRGGPDQLGLLRHDYQLKPAFSVYRQLIREIG